MAIKYSVVVPIFKREDEVIELLDSLQSQGYSSFEIILVDGSPSNDLVSVDKYAKEHCPDVKFTRYYEKGLGISDSRNLGAKNASGEYLLFFDSDVIIPLGHFEKLDKSIVENSLDGFGGPDAAHASFSDVQKAISFSMTSIFTTGGIRGKKSHVGKFKPRGFNMGMRKEVFDKLGGFNASLPVGEDMDLSARLIEGGYKTALIPGAFVYHKRRVSLSKFYKQVFRFGAARIMLSKMHPGEMKVTHLFPLLFVLYLLIGMSTVFYPYYLDWVKFMRISIGAYFFVLFLGGFIESKSAIVGVLCIPVAITQFVGYAMGFLKNGFAVWLRQKPDGIFQKVEGEPESPL